VRRIALALVHHPVLDRQGAIVTSAITNLDVHDIARTAMTFGLCAYYMVHPIEAQRLLVDRITSHWIEGSGARRIPDRVAPMRLVRVVPSLQNAIVNLSEGQEVIVWTTGAGTSLSSECLSHSAASAVLCEPGPPVLIVFGTAWGLHQSIHDTATKRLDAIHSAGPEGYNHLSVRAAAAILLDRLLGEYSQGKHARNEQPIW
jgi:hypothetical protein